MDLPFNVFLIVVSLLGIALILTAFVGESHND